MSGKHRAKWHSLRPVDYGAYPSTRERTVPFMSLIQRPDIREEFISILLRGVRFEEAPQ